jgi:hypothetical protein
MWAATFTPGWGAVTTLVGTLGAVLITQVLSQRGEGERAKAAAGEREADRLHEERLRAADHAHDRAMREEELRDANRERLYQGRNAAFADFYRCYLEYRRAERDLAVAWGHRTLVAGDRDRQPGDLDYAENLWTNAAKRSTEVTRSIEESLMPVEIVASREVRDAAAHLRDLATSAGRAGRELFGADDMVDRVDLWDAYQDAERAVQEGEQRLREAIQAELGLNG